MRPPSDWGSHDRSAHVGYYLIDRGRPSLERAVGCRVPWKLRAGRALRHLRLTLYLGPILLLTLLTTAGVLYAFDGFALHDWRYWFFSITSMIGASGLAVALVNLVVALLVPPRTLPRMNFSQGIPAVHRSMVVVPTLLGSPREIDDLLEDLEGCVVGV